MDSKKTKQDKRIRSALIDNISSPNKLLNNALYHEKCKRKTIIFRPQDASLYKRLKDECPNASQLVRDLLKKHFDKLDGKNNND